MRHERPTRGGSVRVLVADSTRIHTQLLADALRRNRHLEIIAADPEAAALLVAAGSHDADVMIVSSALEEQPNRGLDLLREIRTRFPKMRAVVLLDSSKNETILEAFRAGARGIFNRRDSLDSLSRCIECVHQGQIWANSQEMSLAVEALANSPSVRAVDANGLSLLSKRELEVVRCLAEGLTNREIADRLSLSRHTIKNYLFRVFDKLGVSSRIELLSMTLNRDAGPLSAMRSMPGSNDSVANDDAMLAEHLEAAEQGMPGAQVALADLCLKRENGAHNLPQAYSWYLIAEHQLATIRKQLNQIMTPEQMVEAERGAADWLNKKKKAHSREGSRAQFSRPGTSAAD